MPHTVRLHRVIAASRRRCIAPFSSQMLSSVGCRLMASPLRLTSSVRPLAGATDGL